jgi:hypothetical protein
MCVILRCVIEKRCVIFGHKKDVFFCVSVAYSGDDVCDVTLSLYPHRASLRNMPVHGGNRTYDLWNTECHLLEPS